MHVGACFVWLYIWFLKSGDPLLLLTFVIVFTSSTIFTPFAFVLWHLMLLIYLCICVCVRVCACYLVVPFKSIRVTSQAVYLISRVVYVTPPFLVGGGGGVDDVTIHILSVYMLLLV